MDSTRYNDHEESLKKTLAAKGIYFFGPMLKNLPQEIVEKEPWAMPKLGALRPHPEEAAPPPSVKMPAQQEEATKLMSGPKSLVDRVTPAFRQFTVSLPDDTGAQRMALRVTLEKDGDLIIQGPMRDYAVKVLAGRDLVGQGVESGHAGFYRLANTVWGPTAQMHKVNVDRT